MRQSNALVNFGTGVKINRLEVPEVIKHGDPVTLDCDFTLEDNDQDLVVKWFFNKTLVYQWIPGTKKRPQGLGILKDRLNLEYAASVDANSRHRALHIWKAGPDLSGDYTCSVSTLQSEDIETKSMLVLGKSNSYIHLFIFSKVFCFFFSILILNSNILSVILRCRLQLADICNFFIFQETV
uniref:Uncharacterized protein LOC114324707 isoform X1 n=1 Tax=Diabrotica virgifera virgifera TaxID=50390 RepID=A0A6P7F0F9_DIAVI